MPDLLLIPRHPFALLLISFFVLWFSGWLAATRFHRLRSQIADDRDQFNVIQAATLTLLGLMIGFTFSMALNRYDQRKNLEEEEANAIGTEYVRVDFLPAADAAKVRALLLSYLDQRILFYMVDTEEALRQVDDQTAKLQAQLWSAVRGPASAQPTQIIMSLVVSGMNDVLNSQGYTQAAWRNRIPIAGWALLGTIAVCATMLVGIGAKDTKLTSRLLAVLPLVVSISFFLIADIDTPRRGMINVIPQNLLSLAQSLRTSE